MYFRVLVTDYDGTLARHGRVDPDTLQALYRVRDSHRRLVLATGRKLDDLERVFPEYDVFDRVVAENGAVLYDPARQELQQLAEAPPGRFVQRLSELSVEPLSVGRVIVATWEPHQEAVLRVIHELGLELQVIFNKGAVMVLPTGINKATGTHAALASLEISPHNAVAIGDAENDHTLLADCEVGVAVNNAVGTLKERADWVTQGARSRGVLELIEHLLRSDLQDVQRRVRRHDLPLGHDLQGRPVSVPPQGTCLLVCGSSGAGKSTFISAFIEQLTARKYGFCVIDPEGDFALLPHTVSVGAAGRAPTVEEALLAVSSSTDSVINLLGVRLTERVAFSRELLKGVNKHYGRRGRPHWLICDEAHHVFDKDTSLDQQPDLERAASAVMMATVRPDQLPIQLLRRCTHLVAVGPSPDNALEQYARAVGSEAPKLGNALPERAAVLWERNDNREPIVLVRSQPRGKLRRHQRKYATGELGPDKCFYFRGPDNRLHLSAKNLISFLELAAGVDDDTWTYHLERGDYSTWVRWAIKDIELAVDLSRIEERSDLSPRESRQRVREAVERYYTLPG